MFEFFFAKFLHLFDKFPYFLFRETELSEISAFFREQTKWEKNNFRETISPLR